MAAKLMDKAQVIRDTLSELRPKFLLFSARPMGRCKEALWMGGRGGGRDLS
jgi:hypothetical protein